MKPIITVGILLGLASCASSDNTEPVTTPAPVITEAPITLPPATSPPVPDSVYSEQFLVEFVHDEYPYPVYATDQQIIETGWATCYALDQGVSPTAIVGELILASEGDESISLLLTIITGGATGILCPEYAEVWNQG